MAWGLVVLLICIFAAEPASAAKKNDESEPVSVGQILGQLSITRGTSTEIVVSGIAMPGDDVQFKVHKGPQHGSLGEPRRINKNTVAYPYRNSAPRGVEWDRVDFRLKTGPGNTWGTVVAKIYIQEPASRLAVEPESLNFGTVPIGDTQTLFLRISNTGGGRLKGVGEVGPPWTIDGDPGFELLEGEGRDFAVAFKPASSGVQHGAMVFKTDSKVVRTVELTGGGEYRFSVPRQTTISRSGGEATGVLRIESRAQTALLLRIHAPNPVLTNPEIQIPPGGAVDLPLTLDKKPYLANSVDLVVSDGEAGQQVRVDLPTPPALLEWEKAPLYDLGRIAFRNVPEVELALGNTGATRAAVSLEDGRGGLFLAHSQNRSFELEPGETALIRAYWQLPEIPGRATASIVAKEGGLAHPLDLVAEVKAEEPAGGIETREKISHPTPSAPGSSGAREFPRLQVPIRLASKSESQKLPQDVAYRLESEGGTAAAVVTWKYRGPQPATFQLKVWMAVRDVIDPKKAFEKRLEVPEKLPSSPVVADWVPVESAGIRQIDQETWEGRISGLPSGYHTFRIAVRAPPDSDPVDSDDYAVFVGKIPRPPWVDRAAGGLAVLCLAYLLWRKIFARSAD